MFSLARTPCSLVRPYCACTPPRRPRALLLRFSWTYRTWRTNVKYGLQSNIRLLTSEPATPCCCTLGLDKLTTFRLVHVDPMFLLHRHRFGRSKLENSTVPHGIQTSVINGLLNIAGCSWGYSAPPCCWWTATASPPTKLCSTCLLR